MKPDLQSIASRFALEGTIASIDSLGDGFINDTFIIRTEGNAPDYILQRKNRSVFPDVPAMMENIRKVTEHIRRHVIAAGGDPLREVMTVVPTRDGALCYEDEKGDFWAVTVYIADTIAYNKADTAELARKGGEGIGKFQAQLADFNEPLAETIKGFHNIRHRFAQWDEALTRDAAGRKKDLAEEIGWIESRRAEMLAFWSKVEDGTIPTRVTHNDTKINNILFDKQGRVLCAIDLTPQEYLPPACGPLPHVRAVPAPPFSFFPVLRVRPAPEAYGPLPPPAAPSLPALPHKPSGPPAVPFPSSP